MSDERRGTPRVRAVLDAHTRKLASSGDPSMLKAFRAEIERLRATNPAGWGTQLDLTPEEQDPDHRRWLRSLGYPV